MSNLKYIDTNNLYPKILRQILWYNWWIWMSRKIKMSGADEILTKLLHWILVRPITGTVFSYILTSFIGIFFIMFSCPFLIVTVTITIVLLLEALITCALFSIGSFILIIVVTLMSIVTTLLAT